MLLNVRYNDSDAWQKIEKYAKLRVDDSMWGSLGAAVEHWLKDDLLGTTVYVNDSFD